MTELFIVSYVTGMVPELTEHTVPVRADSLLQLQLLLDAAIKHKEAQRDHLMELFAREPKLPYGETLTDWPANPIIKEQVHLQESLLGSYKVSGRFFACLDDLNGVEDMEILPIEKWEDQFNNADAQDDARRHIANGGQVN